jgi:hypothetical protein
MPDVCDLILDEHEEFRRRFAELDTLRADKAEAARLERVWGPLADKLELHASVEEEVFYPHLLKEGRRGDEETSDAIDDHNEIRDAVRRAGEQAVGSDDWWDAVLAARKANSDHMAEEERGAVPDFRVNAPTSEREALAEAWTAYEDEHPGARGIDESDKDKDAYIKRHS